MRLSLLNDSGSGKYVPGRRDGYDCPEHAAPQNIKLPGDVHGKYGSNAISSYWEPCRDGGASSRVSLIPLGVSPDPTREKLCLQKWPVWCTKSGLDCVMDIIPKIHLIAQ